MNLRVIDVDLSGAAGTSVLRRAVPGLPCTLVGVSLVDSGGVAADASNVVQFQVFGQDGSVKVWEWDTTTGQDGALTAGVPVGFNRVHSASDQTSHDLESGIAGSDLDYDAGDAILVKAVHGAAGKAVAAILSLILRPRSAD